MKTTILGAAFASSIFLAAGPASALPISFVGDSVSGVAQLSDSNFVLIHVLKGDKTQGKNPPETINQGALKICSGPFKDAISCLVPTPTRGGALLDNQCIIVETDNDCSQATIACGPTETQHTVVGAILESDFLGSFDGHDVVTGSLVVACGQTSPPRPK